MTMKSLQNGSIRGQGFEPCPREDMGESNHDSGNRERQSQPSQKKDVVPARLVLYILSFTGFLVSFMMRNDINMAMVAMARLPARTSLGTNSSEPLYCYTPEEPLIENTTLTEDNVQQSLNEEGEFDWNPKVQSAIISSFYWCYVLAQVAGGVLTQKFGSKAVFGYSQLATALSSLLIPSAAYIDYKALIFLRSIQGAASGLTWPAMYSMVGLWIPLSERSQFMSSFQGFTVGIGITYPLCGFIIAHFGWHYVFYVTGSLGLLWCIFWYFLAFDEPEKHPRITRRELNYIKKNIDNSVVNGKGLSVPWMEIFKSLPCWAIGITTFGRIWVHYTFIVPGPVYMKTVLGFSIEKNGLLSGAPFLSSYFSSVLFCYIADYLVNHKVCSLVVVRKIFTALSQVIPGLLVIVIGYLGCDIITVLALWWIAVTLITAAYAGAMANIVDIAPNFAGPVLAFCQTIHMTASFLSPLVAGLLLEHDTSLVQWRKVFGVTSVVGCGTYIMYQFFGTSAVQSWNTPPERRKPDPDTVQPNEAHV